MKAIIGVIDFGMGNIQSVINGFEAIGKKVVKVDSPSSLSKLDGIVLPGVGAFAQGMKNLKKLAILIGTQGFGGFRTMNGGKIIYGESHPVMEKSIYLIMQNKNI